MIRIVSQKKQHIIPVHYIAPGHFWWCGSVSAGWRWPGPMASLRQMHENTHPSTETKTKCKPWQHLANAYSSPCASTSKDWTHLRRIPIAHFRVISQGPPPDPALASSWEQLTSLRHNRTPHRDPFPLTVLQLSPTVFFADGRINSYLSLCSFLWPPDSWMWESNVVSI